MGWKHGTTAVFSPEAFAAPSNVVELGDAASEGVAGTALRSDAVFAFPAAVAPADVGAAAVTGDSTAPAHANHVHKLADGFVTSAMLAGAIANAKLATDPLARANHTGTQLALTVSDFAEAARDAVGTALVAGANTSIVVDDGADTITIDFAAGAITTEQIEDITGALLGAGAGLTVTYDDVGNALTINIAGLGITNAMLAGGIALGKLATDPLARANHTGTQPVATLSDFGAGHDALDHSAALASAVLGDLSDVDATAPSADDVLTWDGASWGPAAAASGSSSEPVYLPAGSFFGAGGPTQDVFGGGYASVWRLDAAAVEGVAANLIVPTGWATVDIDLWWGNAATSAGDVVWELTPYNAAEGAQAGSAGVPISNTLAAPATAGLTEKSTLTTGFAVTPGNLLNLYIQRTATAGGDTLANDAALLGINVRKAS